MTVATRFVTVFGIPLVVLLVWWLTQKPAPVCEMGEEEGAGLLCDRRPQ